MTLENTAEPTNSSARLAQGWRLLSWTLIIGLGLLKLGFPLHGDQALFLSYARGLDHGLRLYADLWDNKQPGIYWFYLVAGKSFGFTAIGMHLLEWLWLACAALMLRWAARETFTNAWVAELVPLVTVGLYYSCAGPWQMTQVEILVATPLAGCLLASVLGSRNIGHAAWMHAAFGLCASIVVTFKLVLAALPIALWLVWVGYAFAAHSTRARNLLRGMLLPALFGAAIPLALVALYLIRNGTWNGFVWTTFVWPRLALLEHDGKSLADIFLGARWLLAISLPPLVLIFMLRDDLKRQPLRLIEAQALAWLIAGTIAILVQRFSWWSYHFLLLVPAVGLIAACACDRLAARTALVATRASSGPHAQRIAAFTVAAMFMLFPLQTWRGVRAATLATSAASGERLNAFRDAIDAHDRERLAVVATLRTQGRKRGDDRSAIYVFGNPNWMLEFDRPQAIPIHGWAWEFMLQSQWAALPAQLRAAAPQFIYIDDSYASLIEERAPEVESFVTRDYQPVARTSDPGSWYLRTSPVPHRRQNPTSTD